MSLAPFALVAAAAVLTAATLAALVDFLSRLGDRRVAVQSLAGTGLVLLALFLAAEGQRQGRLPNTTQDVLAWVALGSVGVHLAVIAGLGIRALGPFLLPVAAACALLAPLASPHPWATPEVPQGPWGMVHGLAALAGQTAFALAFAAGALYLVQAGRLKTDPARISRLPDLETLDRLNLGALLAALPCWTLALVAGALQAQAIWGTDWMLKPLVLFSGGTWVLVAVVTAVRLTATVRGRKIAALSVAAFALAMTALLWGHR